MSQTRLEKLTPEQEGLIPVYREKWRAIALSTEPIDRQKATYAIKAAYAAIDKQEPSILFFDSPLAALNTDIFSQPNSELESCLGHQLSIQLKNQLSIQLEDQLGRELWSLLWRELESQLRTQHMGQLHNQLRMQLANQVPSSNFLVQPEHWIGECSWLDFCISVLNCTYDLSQWEVIESVIKHCSWIFPLEKTCLVCDRPTKLSFNSQQRLHAEGEPALEFVDGYSLYSYQGVTLPKKYGKLPPHQWQAQWLLEESNAEVRRVLIQVIGYARICQELQRVHPNCVKTPND